MSMEEYVGREKQGGADGDGKGKYVAAGREEQELGVRSSPNILDEYVAGGREKQEQDMQDGPNHRTIQRVEDCAGKGENVARGRGERNEDVTKVVQQEPVDRARTTQVSSR